MNEIMDLFKKVLTKSPEESVKGMEKFLNVLLEIERDNYLQRGSYERKVTDFQDYRNGYKSRSLQTRFGSLTLNKPQTRKGFQSNFFERYQRSEQSIILSCAEMYLNGVSTRKVSKLVDNVFGLNVSASTISNYTKQLDDAVTIWRNTPLDPYYQYLFVDATYIKVREANKVVSKAVYIAIGVSKEGRYRILGFTVLSEESEDNWLTFFDTLKERGLLRIDLVISDKHAGLVKAINKTFLNTEWQRCIFHFKQNFLKKVPKKRSREFDKRLNLMLSQLSKEESRSEGMKQVEYFSANGYEKLAEYLEKSIEEIIVYKGFDERHWKRIRTTNKLERLNQEIKRRTKIIRIFPNINSVNRCIGNTLKEMDEKWMTGNKVFK